MSKLVEELKNDHKILGEKLTAVKTKGIVTEEARKELFACKGALLAHLAKEDAQLYPALKKAAQTDAGVKSMLDTFAKDMDQISKAALDFFAKYEKDPTNADFSKDIAHLLAVLGTRISKEEHILYPKYDQIAG